MKAPHRVLSRRTRRGNLTGEECARMRELLRNPKMTHRAIAEEIGVCLNCVTQWALRHGFRRGRGHQAKKPIPVHAAIVAYEQQDMTLREIAAKLGMQQKTLAPKLRAAGLRKRPCNWSEKATTADLLRLWRMGLSRAEIARRVGLHPSTIRVRIERWQKKQAKRTGAASA